MSITELCRSSDSLLAIIAMLFVIAGLFLLSIRFVLSRIDAFKGKERQAGLRRLGYAMLFGAFVLIMIYLALPSILKLMLNLDLIEPGQITSCTIRSPATECSGTSGNVTCIMQAMNA